MGDQNSIESAICITESASKEMQNSKCCVHVFNSMGITAFQNTRRRH